MYHVSEVFFFFFSFFLFTVFSSLFPPPLSMHKISFNINGGRDTRIRGLIRGLNLQEKKNIVVFLQETHSD